jgi:AcrR family transcriptional regulator
MLSARPPVAPLDRRHRRRAQTIEEIVDVALELIAREGAAGLSLGEVARRMGMRTPSLYGYFSA